MHSYGFHVRIKSKDYIGTKTEVRDYIADAIKSWSRGGDPESPLWHIADGHVTVRPIKEAHPPYPDTGYINFQGGRR